jgi:replicative DNA helicase
LKTQSFDAINVRAIESHHFIQRVKGDTSPVPMPGEVFSWMMQHHRRYGTVPSIELTRAAHPLFQFIEVSDPMDVVIDQFIRQLSRRELILVTREFATEVDRSRSWAPDFDVADYMFEVVASAIRGLPSTEVVRYSDSLDRLALYKQREEMGGGTPGISLAIPVFDDFTYGAQPGDLVVIEGFLGIGKSSLAVMIAALSYFMDGKTSFFKSLEMDADKLVARWDSYAAKFQYSAMKRLKLDDGDKQRWEEAGERAYSSKLEKDMIVDSADSKPTADKIYSDVMRWRPDLAIVDTLDELRAPSHLKSVWEQQDFAARELKGVARVTRKPMFGIAQAGRDAEKDGATLGNIANSISIPRKADIVIGLHATPDMKKRHMCEFRLLKNRDDEGEGTYVNQYWDRKSMVLREWRPADAIATKS